MIDLGAFLPKALFRKWPAGRLLLGVFVALVSGFHDFSGTRCQAQEQVDGARITFVDAFGKTVRAPPGVRYRTQWVRLESMDGYRAAVRVSLELPDSMGLEKWESPSIQLKKAASAGAQSWTFDVTVERATARLVLSTSEGAQVESNLIVQTGAPPAWAQKAPSGAAQVSQIRVRILESSGLEKGARVRWHLEPPEGKVPESVGAQVVPGKVALLVQDSAGQAPIRVEIQDSNSFEGEGELIKNGEGRGFRVGQLASLAFRMSAEALEEKKRVRQKAGAEDWLGTWALYAGYSGVGYEEDFRPDLNASYLALSGWGDWRLGESQRFSLRAELATEALPLTSELDQAVSGEQATLARFIRGGGAVSTRVLRFGNGWKVLARPGFSFSTMLISNPQFGYFNMSGPSLYLSLQEVPRKGRKLYLDGGVELLNITPLSFDFGNLGMSFRVGGSITSLGPGEVDAYLKYRAVHLEIDSVQIAESALEVGLGYRW